MAEPTVDLNMLLALDALLEECSVTRAAHALHTSSPAMSRMLGRLRRAFNDPILVRAGRVMVPTPRALAMQAEVRLVVARATAVFTAPVPTEPARLQRTFSVQAGEWLFTTLGFELIARVRAQAPGVVIRFLSESHEQTSSIRDGRVDLEIGQIRRTDPETLIELLIAERLLGVVRSGHELAHTTVTAEQFAAGDHISISRRGKLRGPIDDLLAERGLTRRVTVCAPSPAMGLFLVAHSDLIGLTPRQLGRETVDALGLTTFDIPLALPPLEISMAWHPRHDSDPAHQWLRQCVRDSL